MTRLLRPTALLVALVATATGCASAARAERERQAEPAFAVAIAVADSVSAAIRGARVAGDGPPGQDAASLIAENSASVMAAIPEPHEDQVAEVRVGVRVDGKTWRIVAIHDGGSVGDRPDGGWLRLDEPSWHYGLHREARRIVVTVERTLIHDRRTWMVWVTASISHEGDSDAWE